MHHHPNDSNPSVPVFCLGRPVADSETIHQVQCNDLLFLVWAPVVPNLRFGSVVGGFRGSSHTEPEEVRLEP